MLSLGTQQGYPGGRAEKSNDHSLMPPCQAACPLHMDVRDYVDLVAQGRTMEALQLIRATNPFPAICAYVCTHPCEESCRRHQVDKPVGIRAIKRFAVEFGRGDYRAAERIAGLTPAQAICLVLLPAGLVWLALAWRNGERDTGGNGGNGNPIQQS